MTQPFCPPPFPIHGPPETNRCHRGPPPRGGGSPGGQGLTEVIQDFRVLLGKTSAPSCPHPSSQAPGQLYEKGTQGTLRGGRSGGAGVTRDRALQGSGVSRESGNWDRAGGVQDGAGSPDRQPSRRAETG